MPGDTLVRDVMSKTVATVQVDATFEAAADLMAEKNVGALPVVDDAGHLVGLLRDENLIASEAGVHVPTFINFLGLGIPMPGEMKHFEHELKQIAGASVGDLMDTEPATIGPDATLEDVASILHEHGVNSVPVVDADKLVVGVVARADLVRFIARTT
jgi:CBS domain-containing protein